MFKIKNLNFKNNIIDINNLRNNYIIGKDNLKKGIATLNSNFILLLLNDNQNFRKINKIGIFHYKDYNINIGTIMTSSYEYYITNIF